MDRRNRSGHPSKGSEETLGVSPICAIGIMRVLSVELSAPFV